MNNSKFPYRIAIAGVLTLLAFGTASAGRPTFQGSPPAGGSVGGSSYGHGGKGGSHHGGGYNYGGGHNRGYYGHGHNHNNWSVSIGAYPYWGWGGAPYWGYAPYYSYPYYYPQPAVAQPIVIEQAAPQVYIEQQPQYSQSAPAPQVAAANYWYFCEPAQAYWPYVKECPAGWQRVSPTPPSPR